MLSLFYKLNTNLTKNYISAVAKYYGATTNKNADDLTDGMALIPISTELNTELYSILNGTFAYIMTVFYGSASTENRRTQIAISYNAIPARMAIRSYGGNGWTSWNRIITQAELPTMQSGTQTFSIAAGGETQVQITFPIAFASVPLISLEYKNYGSWVRLSNTNVNKYGITFSAKNTYSGELTFGILWQAIGV